MLKIQSDLNKRSEMSPAVIMDQSLGRTLSGEVGTDVGFSGLSVVFWV